MQGRSPRRTSMSLRGFVEVIVQKGSVAARGEAQASEDRQSESAVIGDITLVSLVVGMVSGLLTFSPGIRERRIAVGFGELLAHGKSVLDWGMALCIMSWQLR